LAGEQHLAVLLALRGGGVATRTVVGVVCAGGALILSILLAVFLLDARSSTVTESGMRSRRWNQLKDELWESDADRVVVGAAADHACAARKEAAQKLIMGRERVLHDITRADGPPRTQPQLVRLPEQERDVDAAMHEVARRLLGHPSGERARQLKPATEEQAAVWAATAAYLSARIQSSTAEVANTPSHEGRAPDMSEEAAAAMRAVLSEIAVEEVVASYKTFFFGRAMP